MGAPIRMGYSGDLVLYREGVLMGDTMKSDAMTYHLGSLDKDLTEWGDDPVSERQFFILAGKLCRVWVNSALPPLEGSIATVHWRIGPNEGSPDVHVSVARLRDASLFDMARELWRRIKP
jgi:hypothetical protein